MPGIHIKRSSVPRAGRIVTIKNMLLKSAYPLIKSVCAKNRLIRGLVFRCARQLGILPKILTIALTYRCQCRCVHCGVTGYISQDAGELSTGEVKALIDKAAKMPGIVQVTFTGGEALLRQDIFELIAYSKSRSFFTKIDTNGVLLNDGILNKLKALGLDRIDISLDHYTADGHDRLRGYAGLFENITKALKTCCNLNILCYLQTYVTRASLYDGTLEGILALSEKLGCARTKIQPPAASGRWADAPDLSLRDEDFFALERLLLRHKQAYFESEFFSPRDYRLICGVGTKSNIYVTSYGDVFPCCYLPVSFGNIRENDFSEIVKHMHSARQNKISTRYPGCLCGNIHPTRDPSPFSGQNRI